VTEVIAAPVIDASAVAARWLLRAPLAARLQELCDQIAPHSHGERVVRLRGGIDAGTHRFDLVLAGGARRILVLRRYRGDLAQRWPGRVTRAWQALALLEQLGLPAPRPVWLDAAGDLFGSPAMVMTYVRGHGLLQPRDIPAWTRQLAETLASIHAARVEGAGSDFLRSSSQTMDAWFVAIENGDPDATDTTDTDVVAARAVLQRLRTRLAQQATALSHGDYWTGNTLWLRGRLQAVVDWDGIGLCPPGLDAGYCRADLVTLAGPAAPDLFQQAYEAATGRPVPLLAAWDLLAAVLALRSLPSYLRGYHDLGRTDLTVPGMAASLRPFLAAALVAATRL